MVDNVIKKKVIPILFSGRLSMEKRYNCFSLSGSLILIAVMLVIHHPSIGHASNHYKNAKTTTTVILIRHAERDNFFNITDEGRKRAIALVYTVEDMGISAIYSPDLSRNLDTVTPLANHLKIDITLIPRINRSSVDDIISEILTNNKGNVVLLVGNGSGNLRILHQRLGGGKGDGPYQYGELYIYNISEDGMVRVTKSKFGS